MWAKVLQSPVWGLFPFLEAANILTAWPKNYVLKNVSLTPTPKTLPRPRNTPVHPSETRPVQFCLFIKYTVSKRKEPSSRKREERQAVLPSRCPFPQTSRCCWELWLWNRLRKTDCCLPALSPGITTLNHHCLLSSPASQLCLSLCVLR